MPVLTQTYLLLPPLGHPHCRLLRTEAAYRHRPDVFVSPILPLTSLSSHHSLLASHIFVILPPAPLPTTAYGPQHLLALSPLSDLIALIARGIREHGMLWAVIGAEEWDANVLLTDSRGFWEVFKDAVLREWLGEGDGDGDMEGQRGRGRGRLGRCLEGVGRGRWEGMAHEVTVGAVREHMAGMGGWEMDGEVKLEA